MNKVLTVLLVLVVFVACAPLIKPTHEDVVQEMRYRLNHYGFDCVVTFNDTADKDNNIPDVVIVVKKPNLNTSVGQFIGLVTAVVGSVFIEADMVGDKVVVVIAPGKGFLGTVEGCKRCHVMALEDDVEVDDVMDCMSVEWTYIEVQ